MQNFQLLVSGFCRTFPTLAVEAFKSNLQTYRKAAFSVAWMKFLSNFHPGKITQERMIVERLLKNSNQQFDSQSVHGVLSVVNESVYSVIHDHVRRKKADELASGGTCQTRSELQEESDDILIAMMPIPWHKVQRRELHSLAKVFTVESRIFHKEGRSNMPDATLCSVVTTQPTTMRVFYGDNVFHIRAHWAPTKNLTICSFTLQYIICMFTNLPGQSVPLQTRLQRDELGPCVYPTIQTNSSEWEEKRRVRWRIRPSRFV
ncbi:hypothetical protein OS493_002247 [Desmophyllum pertusum]|uniref:Uncharacterized protein n=1 Tax=Desmophyllum pertusum TaxID=174260 RepID=A0A9W9Z7R5_9CNID|nr:hypothetical protein OS493_002247 [Desmophyllum pertusum]